MKITVMIFVIRRRENDFFYESWNAKTWRSIFENKIYVIIFQYELDLIKCVHKICSNIQFDFEFESLIIISVNLFQIWKKFLIHFYKKNIFVKLTVQNLVNKMKFYISWNFFFMTTFMIIMFFTIMHFTSFRFFRINVFSMIAVDFKRDKTFETTWNLSDLILILMKNVNKNCEARIRRKLNLFVFAVIKKIWFTILTMIAWFVKIDINDFLHDFIKCRIFFIIHITSTILNFVNQYFVSTDESRLLKNMMNWIWFLIKISSLFESFTTWKIMTSMFICLNAFTFMKKNRCELKWMKKLDLLKFFCKCWYDSYFSMINSFNILTIEKRFLKLFLLNSFFRNKIFHFCNDFKICA